MTATPQQEQPGFDVDRVLALARPVQGRDGTRTFARQWIDNLEESVRVAARQIDAGWNAARSADTRARIAERQATESDIRAADARQDAMDAKEEAAQQRRDSLALAAETVAAIAAVRAGCEGRIAMLLDQLDDLGQRHHQACHLLAERPSMTTTELQTMIDAIVDSTGKVRASSLQVIAERNRVGEARDRAVAELDAVTADLVAQQQTISIMGTVGDAMLDRIKDAATDRRERSSAAVVGRRWRAAKDGVEYVGATGGSSTAARAGSQVAAAKAAAAGIDVTTEYPWVDADGLMILHRTWVKIYDGCIAEVTELNDGPGPRVMVRIIAIDDTCENGHEIGQTMSVLASQCHINPVQADPKPQMCFRTDQPCTVDTCDPTAWICDGVGGCLPDDTSPTTAPIVTVWPKDSAGTFLGHGVHVEWTGAFGLTHGRVVSVGLNGQVNVRLPAPGLAPGSDPYDPTICQQVTVPGSHCTVVPE